MNDETQYGCDVMAIGAHPDDLEHAIGGTLLLLKEAGKTINLVHMCHGEAGTYGSRDKRDSEARAAAAYLEAEVRWMDFEDTRIEDTYPARLQMIRLIRELRPRLILCQYYEFPLMHHDHEQTGLIVRNSFRMCRFKNVDTGNEPFWIPNIAYYLLPPTLKPSFVVDVTSVHERWLELANLYDSQLDKIPGYKDRLLGHKRSAGFQIDVPYGEAFFCDRPLKANMVDITRF
jgi:LmbE family N-acetylglucosaminyl deacetylase